MRQPQPGGSKKAKIHKLSIIQAQLRGELVRVGEGCPDRKKKK